MHNDEFLFWLIMHAGRRGRHFGLKAEAVDAVIDNWLYLLSGISPERQKQGGFTMRRVKELELAASIINRRPVFAEETSGGPVVRYVVERKYEAADSHE